MIAENKRPFNTDKNYNKTPALSHFSQVCRKQTVVYNRLATLFATCILEKNVYTTQAKKRIDLQKNLMQKKKKKTADFCHFWTLLSKSIFYKNILFLYIQTNKIIRKISYKMKFLHAYLKKHIYEIEFLKCNTKKFIFATQFLYTRDIYFQIQNFETKYRKFVKIKKFATCISIWNPPTNI